MDTVWHIIAYAVGCLMLLLFGSIFYVFAFIGHVVVRLLTLGRVQLEWYRGPEAYVAQWIGTFVVLAVAGLIAWLFHE